MITLTLLVFTTSISWSYGDYKWVPGQDGSIPARAILGGWDVNCPLYVGRAALGSSIIPGKVCPFLGLIYVGDNGTEYSQNNYEVLVSDDVEWVPSSGGKIEPGAILGGHSSSGEELYIGRCLWIQKSGNQIIQRAIPIGKVIPNQKLIFPFNNVEHGCKGYDILVDKTKVNTSFLSTLKSIFFD